MFRPDNRYLRSDRNFDDSIFQSSKTTSIKENVIIKIEFNKDIRKIITKWINFEELTSLANHYFEIDIKSKLYIIKYLDEDDDWITVTDDWDLYTAFSLLSRKNAGYGIIRKKLKIKIIKVEKLCEKNDRMSQHNTSITIASSTPSESMSNKPVNFQSNRTSLSTSELTNKFIYPALYNDIFGEYPNIEKSLSIDKPNLAAVKPKQSLFTCADNSKHTSNSQSHMPSNTDAKFQPTRKSNMKKTQVKKSQVKKSHSSIGSNQQFLVSSSYNSLLQQSPQITSSKLASRPSTNLGGFIINANRSVKPQCHV
ncbi:hypothetical protein GJ496_007104 [Pomphorhynchus laevis]|nr:hypothetical protein GJ496_007104 [Pomphorhynchus laevis]